MSIIAPLTIFVNTKAHRRINSNDALSLYSVKTEHKRTTLQPNQRQRMVVGALKIQASEMPKIARRGCPA